MRRARRSFPRRVGALAGLVAALAAGGTRAEDAEPLAQEPAGIVPVTEERHVLVRGIRGDLYLSVGQPGEVRFASVGLLEKRRGDLPVAVWLDGVTLRFEPPAGETERGNRMLQIAVPPGFDARLELSGVKVRVVGLEGNLEVRGERLDLDARGTAGDVHLDLDASTVALDSVGGGATVRGAELSLQASGVQGDLDLRANGGKADLRNCRGAVKATVDGVQLTLVEIQAQAEIRAQGGQVLVSDLKQGGEFSLTGAPLKLERVAGDVTVSSDNDVELKDSQADLHVDSYGGSLRGRTNKGLLEIRTRNATILLENLQGPTRIQGDGLRIHLKDLQGETLIYAASSEVKVEGSSGALTIENDRGDVHVSGAGGSVDVRSRHGDVQVLDSTAPLQVEADGKQVEISWARLGGDTDSLIRNEGGQVTVRFPADGGCRVEANTQFGRVETDLPKVRVLEDGRSAQGIVGNSGKPVVRVESAGDVFLTGGSQEQKEGS